jgi:hypothetical protein
VWSVCGCLVNWSVQVFSFFFYNFCFLFLRHQTMDKVHKHNSFNTNTPLSESYRSDLTQIKHRFLKDEFLENALLLLLLLLRF